MEHQAQQVTENTKKEILEASNKGIRFCVSFDDSHIQNGDRENIRAFNVTWHEDGQIKTRYLICFEDVHKTGESIRKSLEYVVRKFGITNYSICTDAAKANETAANLLGNVDQGLCGSHLMHNIAEKAVKRCKEKNVDFAQLCKLIDAALVKASRQHYNQRLLGVKNYTKIKSICKTRWGSFVTCTESLLANWEILKENSHPDKATIDTIPLIEQK